MNGNPRMMNWRLICCSAVLFAVQVLLMLPQPRCLASTIYDQSDGTNIAVSSHPYVLAPNDQLSISVAGHPELQSTVIVLPDGTISFPIIGKVTAAGITVDSLTRTLSEKLNQTMVNPDVTVSVMATSSQKVGIVGAVHSPGQYNIQPGYRVLDVIAAAGGLSSDPSVTQATLIRAGTGSTVAVDVPDLMNHGDESLNLPLVPGDVLLVQAGTMQQVQVTGAVQKPGDYPAGANGETTVNLLTDAGGPLPDASLAHAQILHQGVIVNIDLSSLRKNIDSSVARIRVMPGDVLEIPEGVEKVSVLGEVRNPGTFDIPDGETLTVVSAIALAGGTVDGSDPTKTSILSLDANNKPRAVTVNLGQILIGKRQDVVVAPKDVVYVPAHSKGGTNLNDFSWLSGPLIALSRF